MNDEIKKYIEQARAQKMSDADIEKNLKMAGWGEDVIKSALSSGVVQESVSVMPAGATVNGGISKKKMLWVGVGILLIVGLIVGGLFIYANQQGKSVKDLFSFTGKTETESNPKQEEVWNKFTEHEPNKVTHSKFNVTYFDSGELPNSEDELGVPLKDIQLTVSGTSYQDITNSAAPESQSVLEYSFGSGNTKVVSGVEYRLKGNLFYLRVGNNPFLRNIFNSVFQTNSEWVKLDLAEAFKDLNTQEEKQKALGQKLQSAWNLRELFEVESVLGVENIGTVSTMHYKMKLKPESFVEAISQSVSYLAESEGESINAEQSAAVRQLASGIFDKLVIENFEVWVGITDSELYKIKFISNAPSIISTAKNFQTSQAEGLFSLITHLYTHNDLVPFVSQRLALVSGGSVLGLSTTDRDAKRVQDMHSLKSALEAYYADYGGYPAAERGVPVGLAPQYIGAIPTSPAPDGRCMDFYNNYWYAPQGKASVGKDGKAVYTSFQYSFCLGSDVKNFKDGDAYKAGIAFMNPNGITTTTNCAGLKINPCLLDTPRASEDVSIEQKIQDFLNKLSFNARFNLELEFTDFGKIVPVEEPQGFFDLTPQLKNLEKEGLSI